jgi:hypothetical protein
MDLSERRALIELAQKTVAPDGVIVVVETPNRLLPWDYHTSQMPFMYQLPDELALRWGDRSPRADFVAAMAAARKRGDAALREAFVRWGRGMSYHELELILGDLRPRALACSWEPALLGERDIHRDELLLQQTMDTATPDVPPSFSRYWLDIVLAATPRDVPAKHMRPWPLQTLGSNRVEAAADGTVWMGDADSRLVIELPVPTSRLAVGVGPGADGCRVTVHAAGGETAEQQLAPSNDGRPSYAEVRFTTPADRFELLVSTPTWVTFVGYEA